MAGEERTVVVSAEEARLLTLGPLGDRKTCGARLGTRLCLRLGSERKPEPWQDLRVDLAEHVRLILRGVRGAGDEQAPAVANDSGIVARRQPTRPDAHGKGEQLVEPQTPVAAHARVGRRSRRIAPDEGRDDGLAELCARVDSHVRNAEPVAELAAPR